MGIVKKGIQTSEVGNFNVIDQGWRYHMSDVNAAIGRGQLKRFKKLAQKRKSLSLAYNNFFSEHQKKIKVFKRDFKSEVPHIYCVLIKGLKKEIV